MTTPTMREVQNQKIERGRQAANLPKAGYIAIDNTMFSSAAFLSLSKSSILVLLRFLQKRHVIKKKGKRRGAPEYNVQNIPFSYPEAKASLGLSTAGFYRSLCQLFELGFLEFYHQGGEYKKDTSTFNLVNGWIFYRGKDSPPQGKKPRRQYPEQGIKANLERKNGKAKIQFPLSEMKGMTLSEMKG